MGKIFVLVISVWGFTGDEWQYIGNQIVLNKDMTKTQCEAMADNWTRWEDNEYYTVSIECHEKDVKT
tara:strand:- start:266 stop:466 length:201 start_codon:yes stop_codon:yes gene_type:complete